MDLIADVPRAEATDYEDVQVGLLPPGPPWPRALGTFVRAVFGGFAVELARIHNRALDLIEEIDPRTTTELIDRWENVLGLPEEGDTSPPTLIADRRTAAATKLSAYGGQSRAYFVAVALSLGYAITITELQRFRADINVADDDKLYDGSCQHVWVVSGALSTDTDLVLLLNKLKPAHTVVLFADQGF